ncbi:MAG: hypothetical protein AAF828_12615 [Bacteroidota bacterium]
MKKLLIYSLFISLVLGCNTTQKGEEEVISIVQMMETAASHDYERKTTAFNQQMSKLLQSEDAEAVLAEFRIRAKRHLGVVKNIEVKRTALANTKIDFLARKKPRPKPPSPCKCYPNDWFAQSEVFIPADWKVTFKDLKGQRVGEFQQVNGTPGLYTFSTPDNRMNGTHTMSVEMGEAGMFTSPVYFQ